MDLPEKEPARNPTCFFQTSNVKSSLQDDLFLWLRLHPFFNRSFDREPIISPFGKIINVV